MKLKFYDTNTNNGDYIELKRGNLLIIRKYIFKLTQKHVASCCNIDAHTYARVESCKEAISRATLEKVLFFFMDSLSKRGWKIKHEEFEVLKSV